MSEGNIFLTYIELLMSSRMICYTNAVLPFYVVHGYNISNPVHNGYFVRSEFLIYTFTSFFILTSWFSNLLRFVDCLCSPSPETRYMYSPGKVDVTMSIDAFSVEWPQVNFSFSFTDKMVKRVFSSSSV